MKILNMNLCISEDLDFSFKTYKSLFFKINGLDQNDQK